MKLVFAFCIFLTRRAYVRRYVDKRGGGKERLGVCVCVCV